MEENFLLRAVSPLLEFLSSKGIDTEPLTAACKTRSLENTLKHLGNIVERRYPGISQDTPPELSSALSDATARVLRCIISTEWTCEGISVADDAPVHAGGFSWVVKVSFEGNDCALAIPKFTSSDYARRTAVRALSSEIIPADVGFQVPRVLKLMETPVPSCLMTYVIGDNCYVRTFDQGGKPHQSESGRHSGTEVFCVLGQMAAGYTTITGEGYGSLVNPQYEDAEEYVRSYTDVIEREVLCDASLDLSRYKIDLAQLREIVAWVKRDAKNQTTSHMIHGDLSPWNLIHDSPAGVWTITDGDDARFGIFGEQIGVCLNSMRGNFNREWIDAIVRGYGAHSERARLELLLRGSAYGVVTYGLINAANPWDPVNAAMCRDVAFSFLAPCVFLFAELRDQA